MHANPIEGKELRKHMKTGRRKPMKQHAYEKLKRSPPERLRNLENTFSTPRWGRTGKKKGGNGMLKNQNIIFRLCNDNDWFTGGDNQAYKKLFDLAGNGMPVSIIAHCIWLVSDDTYLNIYNIIRQSGYTAK